MNTIRLAPLVSLSLNPLRRLVINARLRASQRELEMIANERAKLFMEEKAEHRKQIRLIEKRNALERKQ